MNKPTYANTIANGYLVVTQVTAGLLNKPTANWFRFGRMQYTPTTKF